MSNINKKIKNHLIKQYDGIFFKDEDIDKHINNYINYKQSDYLIAKISPIVRKGSKILDIGSGYGNFVISATKNGFDCRGIELEDFEHKIAQEISLKNNIDPSRFKKGSALSLPYENKSFDVLTFWNVLEHVNDYKSALKEACRVLKDDGKIFIIAPNYCAFRKEAHYRVPWLPLFPKPLARIYLKILKRKTYFLDNCIFYVTYFGLKKFVKTLNLSVSIDINEKILVNHNFKSVRVNSFIKVLKKLNILPIFMKTLFTLKTNPFHHSIDIILKKNIKK